MLNRLRSLYKLILDKVLELQGDPPLIVSSQTKVDNLNADLLDGYHASDLTGTVYTKQIDTTDLTNKYITLPTAPTMPEKTILLIRGAGSQIYNVDYVINGNILDWNGYGIDTDNALSVGNWITVIYY